ncbi:methyl-accepting chemotaxis protein [Azospirillum isscasi]|uniref:Methyl-accepting chemotaxis protein n=1 Tax=Azospirillum isscasi TaxID=3053926 RepID=A0ABU0WP12_9PROT|nr:methyl-accepting chemotaxis protein [Azospirillum isscasi]MDQ2105980.1 methyl-accepting chemotaxis protein [Azospirillum isscasi]
MRVLDSMPLIGKVFLILAVLGAAIATGFLRLNAAQEAAERELTAVIETEQPGIIWLARARIAANATGRLAIEGLIEPSGFKARQVFAKLKEQNANFNARLEEAERALRGTGEDLAGIRQGYERVVARIDAMVAERLEQSDGAMSDTLRDRARAVSVTVDEFDGQLRARVDQALANSQARARATVAHAREETARLFMMVAATLAAVFVLAFLLLRSTVVRPLRRLTDTAKDLLAGRLDRTVQGTGRRDEIGDVARVCQLLKDSLTAADTLSHRTVSAAEQVAAATSQAAAAVEQVSDGSQRQMQSVESITAAVTRTTSIIGTIASVSLSAKDRSREAATRLADALRQMETMTGAVREIAVTSERINRITQSIGELATRSNILSLNAAIEAARAGDHGRGFSVVAEEVGNLAQQTANLAQEIALLAADSGERIQNGVTVATEVGGVMQTVSAAINETDSLSEDIAQSMEEQGGVLRQIEQSLQRLTEISNANATASEEIAATMVELTRLADATRREAQQGRTGAAAG